MIDQFFDQILQLAERAQSQAEAGKLRLDTMLILAFCASAWLLACLSFGFFVTAIFSVLIRLTS